MQISKSFWLIVAAAALAFAAPSTFTRAYADDSTTISAEPNYDALANSGVDLGDFAVDDDVDPAACKDPGGCVNVKKTVKKGKKTLLAGFGEFATTDCHLISVGKWTINKKPKKGKTSTAQFSGTIGSGSCAGHPGTFLGLYYTGTKKGKDAVVATWTTSDFPSPCTTCKVGLTAHITVKP